MKKLIAIFLTLAFIFSISSCGKKPENEIPDDEKPSTDTGDTNETDTYTKSDVNVVVLTGPTGIGAVNMWNNVDDGVGLENYHFSAIATPTEIVSKISNGEADIAMVSTNLAAKLYKVTNGGIKILAVNTLGVLNVLVKGDTQISSMGDLAGKTIVTTGQGANPEYIINYLLTENGLDPEKDVTIEFKAEGSALVSVWETNPDAIIIAPQPVATSITKKYQGSRIALDLTDEWNKVSEDSELMMGCVIVRSAFLTANESAVTHFLTDYKASIELANSNPSDTGALCQEYGIVAFSAVASAAIPNCNLCYIEGTEMKTKLTGYLTVLYNADKTSIGGQMPDDGFWYIP